MGTIFAETDRLRLRALEKRDLPRFPEFLNDWDVVKWLARVPYPYSMDDAMWWFDHIQEAYRKNQSEFFVIASKEDVLMGALGFHALTLSEPKEGELEIGYWLAKPYWGSGLMSEAVTAALPLVFARPEITKLTSFTDPDNQASQNVLRKSGLRYLGIHPCTAKGRLRGSDTATLWEMTREDYLTNFPTTCAV